jgi:GTPase SAR1 family protein
MSEFKLKALGQEVDELFIEAIARSANQPGLKEFCQLLKESHQRLREPMRVAIVGLIKAGKSTLMNALLGEAIVATGAVEATFNVNWLKYGDRSILKVYFKDEQRPPEEKSFAQLAALTLRAKENRDYLLAIKYIEVFCPNEILKTLNIIDTPGLNSVYEDDSENTKAFLQLYGQQLTAITQTQAANADAVLYLFSHSLGMADTQILEQFQGPLVGNATPINAIGVLTKVDFYAADPNVADPLAAGQKIARRLREHPAVRRLFYTIQPVCGLLAVGSKTLAVQHWQTLSALAQLPEERFAALNRNVQKFIKDYEDVPIAAQDRQNLLAHLGQYGISLACDYLRSGVSTQEELVEKLSQHTGLEDLRRLLLSHFGHRAFLIKLGKISQDLSIAYFQQRQRLRGQELSILEDIVGQFDALKAREHAFQELDVLRNYYDGKLDFDEAEKQQLLEVTGEFGTSCGERLGLGERATVHEMIPVAQARMQHWNQKANDYLASDRATIAAATTLARSYERILYRVRKAKEYLY